jgi:invasion protein IalB
MFSAFCWGFGTPLAIAQQDLQAPLPSATKTGMAQGDISAWVKVCAKNEQAEKRQKCVVKYEALDPKTANVLVAVAVSTIEGEDKQDILISVPTAYSLVMPAGVRFKIDEDDPISLQYAVCLPTNCQGHASLSKQVLGRMRKGKQMLIAVINVQQKPLTFQIPLNGFSKTFDGTPVDADKYQETRARMLKFAKKSAMEQEKSQQTNGQEAPSLQLGEPNVTTAPAKSAPAPAVQ